MTLQQRTYIPTKFGLGMRILHDEEYNGIFQGFEICVPYPA